MAVNRTIRTRQSEEGPPRGGEEVVCEGLGGRPPETIVQTRSRRTKDMMYRCRMPAVKRGIAQDR